MAAKVLQKRNSGQDEPSSSQSPSKKRKVPAPLTWLTSGAVQAAFQKGVIDEWQQGFYMDNIGKETLTEKQTHHKDKIEYKIDMHAAREKNVLTDWEYGFVVDNFGKPPDTLSEKQQEKMKIIDSKLPFWKAFQANVISDWDMEFMISNAKRDQWTAKQLPIKERIEKLMEVAAAVLEGQVLSEWEVNFFKDNVNRNRETLSEKQQPIMERIEKKMQAWKAFRAGLLNEWQLDFVKDVVGKANLSEKQQSKLNEIEEKMRIPTLPSFVSDPHSSDEELAAIPL